MGSTKIPGSWPDTGYPQIQEQNHGSSSEVSLKEEDFPSRYHFDHARLNRIVERNTRKYLSDKNFLQKSVIDVLKSAVDLSINLSTGNAISYFMESEKKRSEFENGMLSQAKFAGKTDSIKSFLKKVVDSLSNTNINRSEMLRNSFEEWKLLRQPYVDKADASLKLSISKMDDRISSVPVEDYYDYCQLKTYIDDRMWLSGWPQVPENILHIDDPSTKREQQLAIEGILHVAPDQETRDERWINFRHIINASDPKNDKPSRVTIWMGEGQGTGKSEDVKNKVEKLGLQLFKYILTSDEQVKETFEGLTKLRNKGQSVEDRIGTLFFNIGISKFTNSVHYFNESDNAFRTSAISSMIKQLFDPNYREHSIFGLQAKLPLNGPILIGDGNRKPMEIFDRATLERMALEEYNKTKPEVRLRVISEAAMKAAQNQVLFDETFRPKLRTSMEKMIEIIYNVNETVQDQSYRLGISAANNTAALATLLLEKNGATDIERMEKQVIRYYEKFYPKIRDLLKEDKNIEGQRTSSKPDAKHSEKRKLTDRVRRNLENAEYALGQKLASENLSVSKKWEEYVVLKSVQKESAVQLYKSIQVSSLIPHNAHSELLQGVPIELVGVHNLLRGISTPTPSPMNSNQPSRRGSMSEGE